MFTLKQNAESFFEKVDAKYQDKKLYNLAPQKAMDDYLNLLEEIANKRNYNEGDKIEAEDLERIVSSVKSIISATADKMVEKKDSITTGYFDQSESFPSLMLMNDYLFAMAQRDLGCPDMPANFGAEVENRISEPAFETDFKMKQLTYNSSDSVNRYERQRKINADKLIAKNESLSERLDKNPTSIEIAEYAAEYQALKKRQENHTRVWRFFHKGENKKRTELLAQMKAKLEGILGTDAGIDTKKPSELAAIHHTAAIKSLTDKAFKPEAIGKRYSTNLSQFKLDAPVVEGDINKDNEQLHESIHNEIDQAPKNEEIKDKIESQNPPVLDAPVINQQ